MKTIYTDGYYFFSVDFDNKEIGKVKEDSDHIARVVLAEEDCEIIYNDGENEPKKLTVKPGQIIVTTYKSTNYGPNRCFVIDSPELKENILTEREYEEKLRNAENEVSGDVPEAA